LDSLLPWVILTVYFMPVGRLLDEFAEPVHRRLSLERAVGTVPVVLVLPFCELQFEILF
jgi:hypothetical protein